MTQVLTVTLFSPEAPTRDENPLDAFEILVTA